ncbi:hypothetical protein [Streptomyces albidoflavus]|uniref:hypothetical protein n=1 Tax=Streptomyces albidoflavus TaxID=1886 RepID=UPI004057C50C
MNVPLFAAAGGVHGLVVAQTIGRDGGPEWLSGTIALVSGLVLWRLTAPMRRLASMASPGASMWSDATSRPKLLGRALGAYAGGRALRRMIGTGRAATPGDGPDLDAAQPTGRPGRDAPGAPAGAEPDRPLDLPAPRRGEGGVAGGDGSAALPGTDRGWMPTQRTTDADEWWEAPTTTSSAATEPGAADWLTPPEPTTAQPAPGPSPSTSSATPPEPNPAPAARSGWTTTPPTPGAEPVTLATVAAESTATTPSSSTAATDDEHSDTVIYTPSRGYEIHRPPLTPSVQDPLPLPEMETPDA